MQPSRIQHAGTFRRFAPSLLALSVASAFATPPASTALPTGGVVTAGSASISQSGARMDINQTSNRAILNWQQFNIGSQAQVNFTQPSASSVALNRVLGSDPSSIYGRLTANGQVYLVNTNGVLFGPSAKVDVGGLVASTMDVSDSDFLAGRARFSRNGTTAGVTNQGELTAAAGGYIALLAPGVINEGVVSASQGTVAFGAGEVITLNFSGSGLLSMKAEPSTVAALVDNRNLVQAPGGQVFMSAQAADSVQGGVIRNSGTIEAGGIMNDGGHVLLEASDRIESSGSISADGGSNGNGGDVRLLADMERGSVNLSGTVSAKGGTQAGDGGFVETSGANVNLSNSARVSTLSAYGKTGNWLIDPNNYTIAASGGNISGGTLSGNLEGGNITIQTSTMGTPGGNGDIFVNDLISWSAGHTLTLQAVRNININNNITGSDQSAMLRLQSGGDITIPDSSGWQLSVSNLAIRSAGNVNLLGTYQIVDNLAASMTGVGKTFGFHNGVSLSVANVDGLSGISSNGAVTVRLESGNLTVSNNINAGGGTVALQTPGTLTVNANVTGTGPGGNGGDAIQYVANTMVLNGTTTAYSGTPQISPYTSTRPIYIESTPTAGVLSLTPAELATLHADSNRDVVLQSPSGVIMVTAPIGANQINAGYLTMRTSADISIDAPIVGSAGMGGMFLVSSSDIHFNAPVTMPSLYLTVGGVASQTANAPLTVNQFVATGSGEVQLYQASGGNKISSVAANLSGGDFYLINDSNTPITVASIPTSPTTSMNGITAVNVGLITGSNMTLNAPINATASYGFGPGSVSTVDPLCTTASCTQPNIDLRAAGSFTNNVGASALTLPAGHYWSLVTNRSSTTQLNGLVPNAVSSDGASIHGDILLSENRVFFNTQDSPVTTVPSTTNPNQQANTEADRISTATTTSDPNATSNTRLLSASVQPQTVIIAGAEYPKPASNSVISANNYKTPTDSQGSGGKWYGDLKSTKMGDGSFLLAGPFYNSAMSNAAVEVYDANGNLVSNSILNGAPPPSSVWSMFSPILHGNLYHAENKQQEILWVPAGGYVRVTRADSIAVTSNILSAFDLILNNMGIEEQQRTLVLENSAMKQQIQQIVESVGVPPPGGEQGGKYNNDELASKVGDAIKNQIYDMLRESSISLIGKYVGTKFLQGSVTWANTFVSSVNAKGILQEIGNAQSATDIIISSPFKQ